jgi:hypothetical protein
MIEAHGTVDEWVEIGQINPFDLDHLPYEQGFIVRPFDSLATLKHRAAIDLMKMCIIEGRRILPIAVAQKGPLEYVRLDGFCRFWALKELGEEMIPCVIGESPGCQSSMNPFPEET